MSYAELVQSSQASSICSLASLDKRLTGKGGLDLFLFGRLSLGDAALPTGAGLLLTFNLKTFLLFLPIPYHCLARLGKSRSSRSELFWCWRRDDVAAVEY